MFPLGWYFCCYSFPLVLILTWLIYFICTGLPNMIGKQGVRKINISYNIMVAEIAVKLKTKCWNPENLCVRQCIFISLEWHKMIKMNIKILSSVSFINHCNTSKLVINLQLVMICFFPHVFNNSWLNSYHEQNTMPGMVDFSF